MARRAPLATYVALACLLTWALLPAARASVAVGLVALFGPAVAALITAALVGHDELVRLRARATLWRVSIRWYLVALALPLPVSALRSGLEYLWGAHGAIQLQPISPLGMLVFLLVAGEEVGWRGFALPRLLARFGPWSASALLGVVWALWHLPLFYMPGMPQHGWPFPPFVGYTVALSVILTFLARQTRGSVIIATLFHGAVNTFGVVNTAADATMRGWGNAASYGLAAVMIGVAAWNRGVRRA
jgi:membrane protease YdiL (CAAX protease family)